MSKKYTAAELKDLLSNVLMISFMHIDSIQKNIQKLNEEPSKKEENKHLLTNLHVLYMSISDIIHPALNFCKGAFKGHDDFFKALEDNHITALEKSMFPPCKCNLCSDFVKKNEAAIKLDVENTPVDDIIN